MSTDQIRTTRSSQEIKDEVYKDIDRVGHRIEQFRSRLTPGQLIDDAIFSKSGDRNLSTTFDYLKSNPIGTSFLALGTLLLSEGSGDISFEKRAKTQIQNVNEKFSDKIRAYRSRIDELRSNVDSRSGTFGSRLQQARDNFSTGLSEKIEGAKSLDPMTYMVLGAGLGAITGASYPIKEREANFLRNKVDDKLSKFSEELESALNESVNILKNEFIGEATKVNMKLF